MNPYTRARECGFSVRESIAMTAVPVITGAVPLVYALVKHVDTQRPYESAVAIGASIAIGLASGAAGFIGALFGCAAYTAATMNSSTLEDKL